MDTISNAKLTIINGSNGAEAVATYEATVDENCVGFQLTAKYPDGSWRVVARTLDPTARRLVATGLAAGIGGASGWHLKPLVKGETTAVLSGLTGETPSPTPTPIPTPTPTPAPGPAAGTIWLADGSKAGPTNNPFLEWCSLDGPGMFDSAHPTVQLVTHTDTAYGNRPAPAPHDYWYRLALPWWNNDTGVSVYGDRIEMANEKMSGSPNPQGFPPGVSEWKEGEEIWVAFSYLIPRAAVPGMGTLPYEVKWSENYYGSIPICQFHGEWGNPPTAGAMILGTREKRKNEGEPLHNLGYPKIMATTGPGNVVLWEETLKPDTLYKFLYRLKISATSGLVESWGDNGDGTGFSKHGARTNFQTLDANFMYPCMGGPRNEMTAKGDASVPPEIVHFYAGWNFATSRAAATANAFGAAA